MNTDSNRANNARHADVIATVGDKIVHKTPLHRYHGTAPITKAESKRQTLDLSPINEDQYRTVKANSPLFHSQFFHSGCIENKTLITSYFLKLY